MSHPTDCRFCDLRASRVLHFSAHGRAIRDARPVSDGRTSVVPHRHVDSRFELGPEERADLWALVREVLEALTAEGREVLRRPSDDRRSHRP